MKTLRTLVLVLIVAPLILRAQADDAEKFSVTIVDADGKPLSGATVDCYQYPTHPRFGSYEFEAKQHATSDSKGMVEVSVGGGFKCAVVRKEGFAPGWRTWYSSPSEAQTITLGAGTELSGIVVDDKGQPAAGAEVWVSTASSKTLTEYGQPDFLAGKVTREIFSAKTSSDGRFHIANFPEDAKASLAVTKSGWALRAPSGRVRWDDLPFSPRQTDIKLVIDPAATIMGKVVIKGGGQPLAHAVVGLAPATPNSGYFVPNANSIQSAADGSFRIPDVNAGSYNVVAVFTNEPLADWVAEGVPVTVAAGETKRDVEIQASKGGVLEVTVTSKEDHRVLADVGVNANAEDNQAGGLTGTNGVAYLRLRPGAFQLYVNKQGFSAAQSQVTVTDGQTTTTKIELNAPFKIAGTIRDTSGSPVAGATVGVFPNYSGDRADTKSDSNGHYEISWQQPPWMGMNDRKSYVVARHIERKLAALHEIEDKTKNLDLELKPAMSLSGRIQDTKGKAVTNATAYISIQTENMGFPISRQQIRADQQGRIQIDAVPLGERYNLSANAKGYGSGNQQMDTADAKADHYEFPPLVLKLADRKLAGKVLGTNGQPVVGAQVWMNGEGQPYGNAFTDDQGRFTFDSVCEGAVSVGANAKGGLNASTEAMGGDTNVVLRFDRNSRTYSYNQVGPLTLTGTVYDSSGKPAVGAHVVITPAWGQIENITTDANGEYTAHWRTEPGMGNNAKYFVIARDPEKNLAGIEQIDEKKTRVSVRMTDGLSISGTVLDTKGEPLTRANVNLNMMAGNMGGMVSHDSVKINSDGTFTIPALPLGQQYNIYVTAKDYGSGQKSISKKASETNSIQLAPFKLRVADQELAGQVVGTDGKPISGVWVNMWGNNQPQGNMRTDATGHFKFKVCDGPIQVSAYLNGGGPNSYGNANARGGDKNVVVKIGERTNNRQQRNSSVAKLVVLKPQPWTLGALIAWPVNHKTGAIVMVSVQTALLLGAGVGVFWITRKKKS